MMEERKHVNRKLTDADIDSMVRLLGEGYSQRVVAEKIGCSVTTVRKYRFGDLRVNVLKEEARIKEEAEKLKKEPPINLILDDESLDWKERLTKLTVYQIKELSRQIEVITGDDDKAVKLRLNLIGKIDTLANSIKSYQGLDDILVEDQPAATIDNVINYNGETYNSIFDIEKFREKIIEPELEPKTLTTELKIDPMCNSDEHMDDE